MSFATFALANPGVFTPEAVSAVFPVLLFGSLPALIIAVFLWAGSRGRPAAFISGFFVLGVLGAFVTGCYGLAASSHAVDNARAAHSADVRDWLDRGYGIDAAPENVDALINGDSLAATVDGEQVVISLIPSISGDLTLVDGDRKVIPPVGCLR